MIQVAKKNLVTEVYSQMKNQIVSGVWPLGSKLPSESELVNTFNVSRNTIRGALHKLGAIGMIETRHGSGSYVSRTMANNDTSAMQFEFLSKSRIVDILEYRRIVDAECAYYAALRRDQDDLNQIRAAAQRMMDNVEDFQKYSEADLDFHMCIAKASKNEVFYSAIITIKQTLETHFVEMNYNIGTHFSAKDHWNIYQAIEQKDPDLAKLLMSRNIERSMQVLSE
ncbi:FadR/GntR family transcriptional regulator [Youxingia wuxianensis]|uniref:FadR family transcriptional regulator n=1 Tax=Youxingia wuxianensis TaxID=2763678 RepID=A0A926EKX0_9FIRM|nr:FadR/GntR family transcriptional regulator [Youxingia wuxianensis]MBC8585273.1 FadR family transcriptional regulator [Youxingia wuxianensis]